MFDSFDMTEIIEQVDSDISKKYNSPIGFIVCYLNKSDSYSIWLCEPTTKRKSKLIFNYSLKGKVNKKYHSFAIKNETASNIFIPSNAEVKKIESDKLNTYVNFYDCEKLFPFITQVVEYCVEHFEPSDKFGCCSRYKECSDARKCIHPNDFYARSCWYRKNLIAGKIFY